MTATSTMRPSFETVLSQLSTAVLVFDQQLRLTYLNPAAEAEFSLSSHRSVGLPVDELFGAEADRVRRLNTELRHGQSFTIRRAQLHARGVGPLTVDYTLSALNTEARELLMEIHTLNRLLKIDRDGQHLRARETVRQLVRGLAHEVKNPLGGIRGAAQLLERELNDDGLTDYTRVIIEEADRLKQLVDRMLGPNRLPRREPVNVHTVLERVVQLIASNDQSGLEIVRDYDPSVPELLADADQLIQAFLNIARNATEATANTEHPQLIVRTRVARQFTIGSVRHRMALQVDVIDNGAGVDPEILERMFFPMISDKAGGSGLGLAITQTIIGQHGGVIEVASESGATCFSTYLPVGDNEANEGPGGAEHD